MIATIGSRARAWQPEASVLILLKLDKSSSTPTPNRFPGFNSATDKFLEVGVVG